eukprot:scaffold10.g2239.t1
MQQLALPSAPRAVCSTSYRVAARPRPAASLRWRAAARPAPARRANSQIVCVADISDANFEAEVLKSEVPVLVDFWATWCGPCKLVVPTMVWAEKEYAGKLKVVKVEVDPNPAAVERYGVYGLPCLILFKDGAEVEGSHAEGAVTRKVLQEYLQARAARDAKRGRGLGRIAGDAGRGGAKHLGLSPVGASA